MENVKPFSAGDLIIYRSRPHLIIKIFTNNAGVKYDAMIIPISSKKVIGGSNVIEFSHKKLKFTPSYLKVINLTTVKLNLLKESYIIGSLSKDHLAEIINDIKKLL